MAQNFAFYFFYLIFFIQFEINKQLLQKYQID